MEILIKLLWTLLLSLLKIKTEESNLKATGEIAKLSIQTHIDKLMKDMHLVYVPFIFVI